MNFQENNIYNGFKLVNKKHVKEINGISLQFSHDKSGAMLIYLSNDDPSKFFNIAFRTPPTSNNGLAHIMEHAVLCGSKKYPLKDVCAELLKGTLSTWINGVTYPTFTTYNAGSTNNNDFMNLLDIYLDLTFNPAFYENPYTYMQQAGHFELMNKSDEITFNGVVYNEMIGDYSDPNEVLIKKCAESLFADTLFRYDSDGNPEDIPNITEQEFYDFHKNYYHPSNSCIFLYGDGDVLSHLKFISESYLNAFDKIDINFELSKQEPFDKLIENKYEYGVSEESELKDNTYLSLNFGIGELIDNELFLAVQILRDILISKSSSPLKRALVDAKIAENIYDGDYLEDRKQIMFNIIAEGSNEDQKERFINIIFETLEKLVKEGIDKKLIEAHINAKEFELKEEDYPVPKGLIYSEKVFQSWVFGGDINGLIEYEKALKNIKSALSTNYFENIIEQHFLNNNLKTLVILKPELGIDEQKKEKFKEKLLQLKENLSEEEIEELINKNIELKKAQDTPNSPEDLAKIPVLSLKEINMEAKKLSLVEEELDKIKILFHPACTNSIAYINLLFDTSKVDEELVPYIGLLSRVLGKLDTQKYNYAELCNEIGVNMGGLDFITEAYGDKDDIEIFKPKLECKTKVLLDKLPKFVELISEILNASKFDDRKNIKELLSEIKSDMKHFIYEEKKDTANLRQKSNFSKIFKYKELTRGIDFYKFIVNLEKNFEDNCSQIIENLNNVKDIILNKRNLITAVTIDEKDYELVKINLKNLFANIKDRENNEDVASDYKQSIFINEKEALITPSDNQYVVKGYNFKKLGFNYTGSLKVLETILNSTYLWEKVRVQNGAYCSYSFIFRNGDINFISYDDPNIKETLDIYDAIPDYLKTFNISDREILKYIIGTIAELDYPMKPNESGETAVSNYLWNITQEDIQRERDEVLKTTVEDIQKLAELVSSVVAQNCYCVLGSGEKITENKDIFSKVINVFK